MHTCWQNTLEHVPSRSTISRGCRSQVSSREGDRLDMERDQVFHAHIPNQDMLDVIRTAAHMLDVD
jgi:hypothetical protein